MWVGLYRELMVRKLDISFFFAAYFAFPVLRKVEKVYLTSIDTKEARRRWLGKLSLTNMAASSSVGSLFTQYWAILPPRCPWQSRIKAMSRTGRGGGGG